MSVRWGASSSQYAIVVNPTPLNLLAACTHMCWFNLASTPAGSRPFYSRQVNVSAAETIWLGVTSGRVLQSFTSVTGSGGAALSGGSAAVVNTWYHGAWTFNGTVQRLLYLNGAEVANGPATGTLASTNREFLISANNDGTPLAPALFFDGRTEDIRIYNRALGPDIIQTIYATRGTDGIFDGLIARYPLLDTPDSQSVTRIANLSSNSSMNVNTIPNSGTGSDFNATRGRSAQLP